MNITSQEYHQLTAQLDHARRANALLHQDIAGLKQELDNLRGTRLPGDGAWVSWDYHLEEMCERDERMVNLGNSYRAALLLARELVLELCMKCPDLQHQEQKVEIDRLLQEAGGTGGNRKDGADGAEEPGELSEAAELAENLKPGEHFTGKWTVKAWREGV